jgi:hypothetical protein
MLTAYEAPPSLKIWGDAANPTDIMELNAAFRRIESPYRVIAVEMENKLRTASVERLNDLLGRNAIRFRRGIMAGKTWMLGRNASSNGTPVEGSRLIWEVQNWCYPDPKEGQSQKQDPDDHTADGADAIASMRYAVMSWWKKPAMPADVPKSLQEARQRLGEKQKTDYKGDEALDRISKHHEAQRRHNQKALQRLFGKKGA